MGKLYREIFKFAIIPRLHRCCKNNAAIKKLRVFSWRRLSGRMAVCGLMVLLGMNSAAADELPIYGSLGGEFTLTDMHNQPASLLDWRGKVVILTFGFTSCPHICPTILMSLSQRYLSLGELGQQVQIVFISIDPKRDTPEQLRRYLSGFHANIVGLTGSADQLSQVAKTFGAVFAGTAVEGTSVDNTDDISHTDRIYLLDQQGRVRKIYPREGQFDQLQQDIVQLLPPPGFCTHLPASIAMLCHKFLSS